MGARFRTTCVRGSAHTAVCGDPHPRSGCLHDLEDKAGAASSSARAAARELSASQRLAHSGRRSNSSKAPRTGLAA
jgi:hypothetical protein